MLRVLILASFITSCFSLPEETIVEKKPVETTQPEKKKIEVYNTIFRATRDINSRSFAMLSMVKYRTYDSMPDYLKTVYDANETYVETFQIINTFGTCYNDGSIVWKDIDEQTSIKSGVSRLEAARNSNNSELVDYLIKRLHLGMAQNIIIAATDYLNFVIAVSNAESAYYDENTKDRLSYDKNSGIFRIISREEQLQFTEIYNSVKNEDYKEWSNALLTVSQRLLKGLNSDLLLPVAN
jgi:hypothetical protein